MEGNCSPLSLLLSFLSRRLTPAPAAGSAVDARQIIREYAVRELNLLLWFSLIAITLLLLKHLVMSFDLRRRGSRAPAPPCLSTFGCWKLFAGGDLREDLNGLLSKSHEKPGSVAKLWLGHLFVSVKDPICGGSYQ